jgi:hypothetical protein
MDLRMNWILKRLVTQSSHGSDTDLVCASVCASMFVLLGHT